ncbi:acyl-CoA dehydrogenase family protein [Aquibium sp. LZ166]|uniref:Acyl-[acyl-carrier-protein] dehydrogenase MbtN n=1 Tax=Aquibium pacificus TaxID=3153579 RepID=A0ABV3SKR5_9HYPH
MIPRTLFSEEHEMFRSSVRRFVEREVVPYHAAWEEAGQVPREAWLKAGEAGLLCCNVPAEWGGVGAGFLFSAIVIEELARVGASAPSWSLHSDIVAPYLVDFGSDELRRRWLPAMTRGEAIAAVAMTEPSGGSDLRSIRTRAMRKGDRFVLNGQKVFITNGISADLVVVACKTGMEEKAPGISLFLVEADRPGFRRGRKLQKIGCKGQDTAELFLEDVDVPDTNLLGIEGRGFDHLVTELAQERLVQAVRSIAAAEAVLGWTVDYVTDRQAFGRRLSDFQNTQFKIADIKAECVASRVFVDRCLELHLAGLLDATDAAIAKLTTTELLGRVTDQCLQFFGGWGYMTEFPVARAFVDARMARIAAGTSEIMRQIIARSIIPRDRTR